MPEAATTPTLKQIADLYRLADQCQRFLRRFHEWSAELGPLPEFGTADLRSLPRTEAVIQVLDSAPHKSFTTRQLYDELVNAGVSFNGTVDPIAAVSSVLSRHAANRAVLRAGRGLWTSTLSGVEESDEEDRRRVPSEIARTRALEMLYEGNRLTRGARLPAGSRETTPRATGW